MQYVIKTWLLLYFLMLVLVVSLAVHFFGVHQSSLFMKTFFSGIPTDLLLVCKTKKIPSLQALNFNMHAFWSCTPNISIYLDYNHISVLDHCISVLTIMMRFCFDIVLLCMRFFFILQIFPPSPWWCPSGRGENLDISFPFLISPLSISSSFLNPVIPGFILYIYIYIYSVCVWLKHELYKICRIFSSTCSALLMLKCCF